MQLGNKEQVARSIENYVASASKRNQQRGNLKHDEYIIVLVLTYIMVNMLR